MKQLNFSKNIATFYELKYANNILYILFKKWKLMNLNQER